MAGLGSPRVWIGLLRLDQETPPAVALTSDEAARRDRLAKPRRAAQYSAGRWLLRKLCAVATGQPLETFTLNAEGAPRPAGPAGLPCPRVSLAHSGDWVVAAAAFGPVGIDLECTRVRRDWRGLGRHLGLPEPWDETSVLRAWTLTEARFKAGEAGGGSLWRFESADYFACLVAPPLAAPEPVDLGLGASCSPDLRAVLA